LLQPAKKMAASAKEEMTLQFTPPKLPQTVDFSNLFGGVQFTDNKSQAAASVEKPQV
jgi:hypothetical protein